MTHLHVAFYGERSLYFSILQVIEDIELDSFFGRFLYGRKHFLLFLFFTCEYHSIGCDCMDRDNYLFVCLIQYKATLEKLNYLKGTAKRGFMKTLFVETL